MKITLNLDTDVDAIQTVILATRAENVRVFLVDLLSQTAEWYWEKPDDEQAAAFSQVYHWLVLELEKRGLMLGTGREGVLQARDGTTLAQSRAPKKQPPNGESKSTNSGTHQATCHQ